MRYVLMITAFLLWPALASANDKLVRLHAPQVLIDTGLMKHILPRFSLKTQTRVELVAADGGANILFGQDGRALFQGGGTTWHMDVRTPDHTGTARFVTWLRSDVGQRTIFGFAPDGVALFAAPEKQTIEVAAVALDGDATLGLKVSRVHCARCHAIEEAGRKNDIGSTPSFFVLRSLKDWQERFEAFYVLNPHPAFTQIPEVTPPFPEGLPSPIVPVELTLEDLEAVLAYVSTLSAADLGSPLVHQ